MTVSELQLERRDTLDHLADAFARASCDALRIELVPVCSTVNLRGTAADQSLITDVQRVLGIELPLAPNRWHGGDSLSAIWLGPDEWLLIARDSQAGEIEQAMHEARPSDPWLSVVDVSHSYSRMLLCGTGVRDLLGSCCPLDLHPDVFSRGDCAQTILARVRALLLSIDGNSVEVCVRNSFASYLAKWLLDACTSSMPVRE